MYFQNRINMIRLKRLNDTNMMKTNKRQQKIISIILQKGEIKSSGLYSELKMSGEDLSLVTVKRELTNMALFGFLSVSGSGRAVVYKVSEIGRTFADIDARSYCAVEPDKRYGLNHYNFELFPALQVDVF